MSPKSYRNCRTYTDEVRQRVVAMVQAGTPISEVSETMDIPRRSIANWVKPAEGTASETSGASEDAPSYDALATEVQALRTELAQLREDNALLGKASAYFAQHAQTRRW